MKSLSLSDRYAAAKALSHFSIDQNMLKILESKLEDNEEHIYIKMECAATLARNDNIEGFRFIERCINGDHLVERLEAVIICSEIKHEHSFNILTNCLTDPNQHHEIRAGAAWALGELKNEKSIDTLISSFNAFEPSIKIEAARALAKFSKLNSNKIIPYLQNKSIEEKQGISWAISKSKFRINDLLPFLSDDETRIWISYIIGVQDKERYLSEIESLKERDSEVYFAVTVLWKIMESWINGLEEY
jgi:hypothetical protein